MRTDHHKVANAQQACIIYRYSTCYPQNNNCHPQEGYPQTEHIHGNHGYPGHLSHTQPIRSTHYMDTIHGNMYPWIRVLYIFGQFYE